MGLIVWSSSLNGHMYKVARFAVENRYQKDTCYDDFGL